MPSAPANRASASSVMRYCCKLLSVYQTARGLYGSPRIHAALRQQRVSCSRKRVARLTRQAGLHSRRRPKRRLPTTDSRHNRPLAPNRLQQDFSAHAPTEKWVGDLLGIWTDDGGLYLAALVSEALGMALAWRAIRRTIVLTQHTDRGSQYTADDYLALLKTQGIQVSMSDKATRMTTP